MKFKTALSFNFKNKINYLTFFLIGGLLLNTYSNYKNNTLFNFVVEPTATISASNTAVCKDESVTITFEGANGIAPYTFTYQINNGSSEEVITTSGNSIDITFNGAIIGDFTYKLTNVKDSTLDSMVVLNQEVSVKVYAPPTVDFTFDDNACSGTMVAFKSDLSGNGALTYEWDFGDGTTSEEKNPSHIFESIGCGSEVFQVKLLVKGENGCSTSLTKPISVLSKLDMRFRDFNTGLTVFSNCENASSTNPNYEVTVQKISNATCANSYSVNWGDGTTSTSVTFPANHTYTTLGVFIMTISAEASNSCLNSVSYEVINVTNPKGGIESPGNTSNLCVPTNELNFKITGWIENTLDTKYIWDFGDGTPIITYTQAQLEASPYADPTNPEYNKFPVPHSYTKGSCSQVDGQYIAKLRIQNACGFTPLSAGGITVLDTSISLFESVDFSCVDKSILFKNKSTIGDGVGCSNAVDFIWDFGDGVTETTYSTETVTNQSHTYTNPGTYIVRLTIPSARCGDVFFEKEICIEPELIPSFTVNTDEGCIPLNVNITNSTDESQLCSTANYDWEVDYTSGNCGDAKDWEFVNGTKNTSENPEFIFNNSGKYTLTQNVITSCGVKKVTKIIHVKKPPTVSIDPISDSCGAVTINPIAKVENCASTNSNITYKWTFIGGNPATSTSLDPGNIEFTSPGTHTISLEVTSECSPSTAATQTFEVFEKPIITNTALLQEICSNQATNEISLTSNKANTTYSWSATASANITGFIANGTATKIPAQVLINNSNVVGTLKYTVIPKLETCEGDTVEFIITVNPASIVSKQPISSDICLNGTPTELVVEYEYGTGTPAYQWFSNADNNVTTGNPILSATSANYNPPSNTVGITYYYAEISFSSGGCSIIKSNTASVNVNEQLTINSVATSQIICVGGTANEMEVTYTNGSGTPSYQWFLNTTNTNVGGAKIESATNAIYLPDPFLNTGIFYYYVEVSVEGNGCASATSNVYQIEVVSDPVIDSQPIAFQELCQGALPADLIVSATVAITADKLYQWFSSTSSTTTGGTLIFGETSNTFSPPTLAVGTFYYYVVVSQAASGCKVISAVSELKINEAPTFTKQPIASEICVGGSATSLQVTYENGTGIPAFQWFSNVNNTNSGGNKITNATDATYNPPTDNVGIIYYYAEISFDTGGCSQIFSETAKVNVVPQVIVNPVAPPQAICVDGTADEMEVTFTGGTGTVSYQWFLNGLNSNTGGTLITGQTASKFTPNVFTTTGDFYYYAEIYLDGDGCTSALSDVFEINVFKDPVIDSQPIASQELCQGALPVDLTVSASEGTATVKNYQWFSNTSSSNTSGTLLINETSDTFTPPTTTVGTFYYYVIVSQAASGCSVISDVSELKINEAPVITTQPSSSEICLDGSATRLEVAYQNGTGTAIYQWFSNADNNVTSGNPIPNATNATHNPPTNTVGETYYYAEISFSSGGCSIIKSNSASVIVNEQLRINSTALNQVICEGGIADQMGVTYTGGAGNATYQWYKSAIETNIGGSKIDGAVNAKYTPNMFSDAGTFYYYVEVFLDGNGCNLATSDVYKIEVVSDPVIDAQPIASQELCEGALPLDLTVSVSKGTLTVKNYQWFSNTSSSNTGGTLLINETSDTFTPPTTTVGAFYYYVLVSQPESGCTITSAVSELKINKAPTFSTQPKASEICLEETATLLEVEYQNGTGAATYQWFSNSSDSTTGGNLITGETNAFYQPSSDAVGTIYYYVKISFSSGGCQQIISNTAAVIVNEIPVINDEQITIYSKATFTFNPNSIAANTIPVGTKYTWTLPTFNPAGSILGASAETNSQDQISQALENTSTLPVKVRYTITPATANCVGNSFILEVTVNPSIESNTVVINNSCFESNDASITTNIIGGIPFDTENKYIVSWSGPNGFSSTDTDISNLAAGIYTLRIEDKEGFSITEELEVTQPNILSITKDIEKNISCFQGNDGVLEVTIAGGTLPYTYNWSTTDGNGIVSNTKNQNTLTAGTYTLEIVDKNNCKIATNFILTEPEVLKIEMVSKQDILCFGDATGAIEISVSGGTQVETSPGIFDYLYSWSGPNGFTSTSKNITNLFVGTYTVVVLDNLGCTISAIFIINQSTEIKINFEKTNVTCYKANDGTIKVTVSGGKAPHQISWSNLASGFSLSNLSANIYIATITDANNCTAQVSIKIEEPVFFIEPVVTPISCNGENDAVIKLNLSGGIAPFSVTWNDGSSEGLQRNNLAAGTYSVVILDSDTYQCPIERTFIITNPPLISVSTTVIDAVDCDRVNSGSIDLETSGGTAPYSFKWSTNETTEDIKNIPQGDYSVEITDANGCTVSRQFTIFRQEPITITFEETTLTDCDLKIVSKQNKAKVAGGFLPYTYSWSAGIVSGPDDEIMTTSQNGSYILTITDAKGCEKSNSFIVNVPTIGSADFRYNAFALTTYNLLSIEDPIQFTNLTTGDFTSLKWDFGDGSAITNEENPVHTYNSVGSFDVVLTVEFTQGCTEVFERTITITQGYSLIHPTAFTPNDDGYNETIRPSYRGFTNIRMTIYDTWGTTVYQEEGVNLKGWNGLINGKPAENGNYVMVVRGNTFYEKEITKSSPVTLLK
ncbi:PKD domain-containing protein [Polaribacter glomeratus]|uniref:PKD domain-containing protein n=1 Tax=Polaribacter glomeratus TaxID=102 RepID=A0A2S7WZ96_9FLAO|nr:PKD domain-containing protein [Polaribacter glomeratus]PQJ82904.1 hypothetical protein BTO16_10085 [Polaribacter glomeratus]TXD64140.1 PKD domain-containing protein [Polaribacter glomeratus]